MSRFYERAYEERNSEAFIESETGIVQSVAFTVGSCLKFNEERGSS